MRYLKQFFAITLVTILSLSTANAALTPEALPKVIEQLVSSKTLANPAMLIIDGKTGETVFEKNADVPRKPASVMKLLAGVSTLEYLDPESSFNTTILHVPSEKLIVIRGSLDPWISLNTTVARKMHRASLPFMAYRTISAVKNENSSSLKGYTVLYSNLFSQDVANFKKYWSDRGFKPAITKKSSSELSLIAGEEVVVENSPPVNKILEWMLLWSDNLLAERLTKIAARSAGYSMDTAGVEMIFRELLAHFEIDDSKLVVADASGLSKSNRVTSRLIATLLFKIRLEEKFAQIYEYLPVSGVSGTLSERYLTTAPDAVGLIRAKTGTLNGTATLAGYIEAGEHEYIFVTLADTIPKGNAALEKARAAIDRMLGRIAAPNIPTEISPAP
jgi:D-alanyl-D-alanine carboxypeptidase